MPLQELLHIAFQHTRSESPETPRQYDHPSASYRAFHPHTPEPLAPQTSLVARSRYSRASTRRVHSQCIPSPQASVPQRRDSASSTPASAPQDNPESALPTPGNKSKSSARIPG